MYASSPGRIKSKHGPIKTQEKEEKKDAFVEAVDVSPYLSGKGLTC